MSRAERGRPVMQKPLLIRAKSDDIPGLATEVEAIEALFGNLMRVIPERPEPTRVLGQGEVAFEVLIRPFGTARFAASWWGAACSMGRDSEIHRLRCEFVVWVNDGYCYRSTLYDLTDEEPRVMSPCKPPANPTLAQAITSPPQDRCRKGRFCAEKRTIEPVFAIVKPATGFRHLTRVLNTVQGKWTLACPALNRSRTDVFLPQ